MDLRAKSWLDSAVLLTGIAEVLTPKLGTRRSDRSSHTEELN